MSESLKRDATRGVMWSAVERFSVQGVQFLLSIVIARLVAPAEFGLIAMLAFFLAIAQCLIDSGFSQALIQKKDRSEVDFSTILYFNAVASTLIYILLFVTAPYIAQFYGEPQLESVARWIGLNLIISGLSIVQRAKLTIKLDFKTQAKASLISVFVGGVLGVYMAYEGYGVWALVAQSLSSTLLNTLLLWVFARWRPSLVFSMDSFRSLFAFGSKLMAGALLQTTYMNLYSLVIGRYYSAADVGYYNRAYSLSTFPSTNITGVVSRAIYPLQCQMQGDDERLSETFIQYLRLSCFVIFPLMVGLAVLAKPLILLLLTERWLPAALPLSILSIAYMFQPVMFLNWQLLTVKGRSDLTLRSEVIKKVLAIAILCSTMSFGLRALCLGVLLYNLLDMAIILFYVRRVLPEVGYRRQIVNLLPMVAISAIMGGVVYLVRECVGESPAIELLAGVVVGVLSYATLCFALRLREVETLRSLLKR